MALKRATSGILLVDHRFIVSAADLLKPAHDRQNHFHAGAFWSSVIGVPGFSSVFEKTYVGQRLNIKTPLRIASDGRWCDLIEDFPADGTSEYLGQEGRYHRYLYTAGPGDRAWMQEQDKRYLLELKDSEDPADQSLLHAILSSLDPEQPEDQRLLDLFASYRLRSGSSVGGGSGSDATPLADEKSPMP